MWYYGIVNGIADNIANIDKNIDAMTTNVKFIKDIAEKEYTNKYSTVFQNRYEINYSGNGKNEDDAKKILEIVREELEKDIDKSRNGVPAY